VPSEARMNTNYSSLADPQLKIRLANCREILGSCFLIQFLVLIAILQVQTDVIGDEFTIAQQAAIAGQEVHE